MRRYWHILRKYKISLALCPILVLITVWCETIQPMYMAEIVDQGVMKRDLSLIAEKGVYMILISLSGLGFSVVNVYIASRTSIGFGTDLRGALFEKIQRLSFFDLDHFSTSSLITRLTNDIARIQQVVLMSMRMMLRSPFMLVMAIFFVVQINKQLALTLMASIPALSIAVFVILRKGFPYFLLWTKPGAPYICMEPWCGISDRDNADQNFKTKQGIEHISAHESFVREHTIEVL